jgi:DNA primase
MTKRVLPIALALGLLAAGCGPASLDTPAGRAERLSERMVIALGLDAEQEQRAKALAIAFEEAESAWSRQRSELSDSVARQLVADRFDTAALEALSRDKALELEQSRTRLIIELQAFHAALKPAQREEAARLLQRWMRKIGTEA